MAPLILLCALVSLFASTVQSVTGFGYGIIFMAILPHFTDSVVGCTVVVGFISLLTSAMNAWNYRRSFRFRDILIPFLIYIPVSVAAVYAAGRIEAGMMKRILGVVLILSAFYFMKLSGRIHIRPTVTNGMIASALSAVLGGLFSTGGPPVGVYYLAVTHSKEEYLGSIQCFFMLASTVSSIARIFNGYVTREVLLMSAAAAAAAFFGVLIARKLVKRLDAERQKKYIYLFMAVSGTLLLVS